MMTAAETGLMWPAHNLPEHVTLQSPALEAMTDLSRVTPVTVEPEINLDEAELRMRTAHVRLLFILDAAGTLLGIVTLNDIHGMRPLRFEQERGIGRDEVLVRDIMTPRERLEALSMNDVTEASIGDIIETLKSTGRQHALVIERSGPRNLIRGLFSASSIGRQLGVVINTSGIAWTFAELESALAR
ncbi:MAG: CBS domain-containing protein [Gammaproteobacteria bacterium]|nr:CBS domain-containing protein [Gammaproteobacteria bacterium]